MNVDKLSNYVKIYFKYLHSFKYCVIVDIVVLQFGKDGSNANGKT